MSCLLMDITTISDLYEKREPLTALFFFHVFAAMMAMFLFETVMGFQVVRELVLWHKRGRTTRKAVGRSHHEWGF